MRLSLLALPLALAATVALAHGPTPQKVSQSITVKAAPDVVWKVAGDFAGIGKWHPAIAKAEGSAGGKDGGTRTLTLKSGGTLTESLDEWKPEARSYSYRMSGEPDLKALPVSSYSATLTIAPEGDGSKVEWMGRFYRGDTGNEPPDNLSDDAGREAMNRFFSEGLKGLKAAAEGGKATQ